MPPAHCCEAAVQYDGTHPWPGGFHRVSDERVGQSRRQQAVNKVVRGLRSQMQPIVVIDEPMPYVVEQECVLGFLGGLSQGKPHHLRIRWITQRSDVRFAHPAVLNEGSLQVVQRVFTAGNAGIAEPSCVPVPTSTTRTPGRLRSETNSPTERRALRRWCEKELRLLLDQFADLVCVE